jgi:hypothetical protein
VSFTIIISFYIYTQTHIYIYVCTLAVQEHGWLRHSATSQKVVGLIHDVTDFSTDPNCSGCAIALGSTQYLTKLNTRHLPGYKEQPVNT